MLPFARRVHGLAPFLLLFAPLASGCGSKDVSADAGERPLEVRVVDAVSERPVSGVEVSVERPGAPPWPARRTDEDGRVVWRRGVEGTARIRAADPQARYMAAGREVETSGPVDIALHRGGRIAFRVRPAGGEPVEPEAVVWTADHRGGRTFRAQRRDDDPGARFEIGPLAAGPAKVFVRAPGYRTRVFDVVVAPERRDLGEVVLEPGGTVLTGQVAEDVEPRPDEAYFRFAGAGLAVPVDGSGRFEIGGLPETRGTLVLRRSGRELFSREVAVRGDRADLGRVAPSS